MKRLVQRGILTESLSDSGSILGWSVNKGARSKLCFLTSSDETLAKKGPVYRTSYIHDVALRQVRETLEASKAITRWIPEHVLKAEVMRRHPFLHHQDRNEKLIAVPDALLHLRSGGVDSKAAIELELTQKSKKRLYKKIEAYVTTDDFNYAFFIAGTDHLMNVLQEVHKNVLATSWRVKLRKQRNGIYFATLENIRTQGIHAQFVAVHDTLSFAELTNNTP
jgi:hypothetical protein